MDSSAPALNPSLIVGLCILGAIFFCVILASVIRLCQRMPSRPSYNAENPPEDLFRPYSQEQVERMREVRWLNHSEMWETGKQARMEMGEQFGPRPKLNRRTGVGWGFVVGKDGYMRKADHGIGEAEDAWSSQGTSGDGGQSMANDNTNTSNNEHLLPHQNQPYLRPSSSYYEDCDPAVRYSLQHPHSPLPSQLGTTYEELDRSDDEGGPDHIVTEPFPDLRHIPGIEQRFLDHDGTGRHLRMVRNDDLNERERDQVQLINPAIARKPVFTLNDESDDMTGSGGYEYADTYGTGQTIAMRDLTAIPHAR